LPRLRPNHESGHKPAGYSHVGEVLSGKVVYIAGQVALDRSGTLVGKDDFRAQTKQVFENLKAALEAAGGSFSLTLLRYPSRGTNEHLYASTTSLQRSPIVRGVLI
jgi:enamine deaminase RidA (YjgF/YER057c/UK114 family)